MLSLSLSKEPLHASPRPDTYYKKSRRFMSKVLCGFQPRSSSSLNSPLANLWHFPFLFTVEPSASDSLVSQQNKSDRDARGLSGWESGRRGSIHSLFYKVYRRLLHLKSYLRGRGWDGCLFWMAETGRKVAVKIVAVIQILLTFPCGMFAGFFEKGNHKKNKSETFHTGWTQRGKSLWNADSVCNVCGPIRTRTQTRHGGRGTVRANHGGM